MHFAADGNADAGGATVRSDLAEACNADGEPSLESEDPQQRYRWGGVRGGHLGAEPTPNLQARREHPRPHVV